MSGIWSTAASSCFDPNACVNDPSSASKPSAQTSAWTSSLAAPTVDRASEPELLD